eukprot:TRINITY_DN16219_c0_g1_i7.p2 TRINITY_DN16219_c0_g1~~TRINITY_DN16219_c0_g1_i7.p2  ORF type:complete len:267 (+),score=80.65 TRINITY_DN16219_c0_g1_i7:112-801(+)
MSLAYYGDDEEFSGEDALPVGGYRRLVEQLAAALPAGAVRLAQPVEAVELPGAARWDGQRKGAPPPGDAVHLRLRGGGTLRCGFCIITVPLALLKAGVPRFDPPLPAAKALAISRLGISLLDKVALAFESPWWESAYGPNWGAVVPVDPEDSLAKGNASTLPFQFVVNKTQAAGAPLLVCYAAGEAAAALERLSDPEAVAAAHRALSAAFPRAECPQPVAAAVSWLVDG